MPTCPNCGQDLDATASGVATVPPWLCATCARAWWDAELTEAARAAWNAPLRCFDDAQVVEAAQAEHDDAVAGSEG